MNLHQWIVKHVITIILETWLKTSKVFFLLTQKKKQEKLGGCCHKASVEEAVILSPCHHHKCDFYVPIFPCLQYLGNKSHNSSSLFWIIDHEIFVWVTMLLWKQHQNQGVFLPFQRSQSLSYLHPTHSFPFLTLLHIPPISPVFLNKVDKDYLYTV